MFTKLHYSGVDYIHSDTHIKDPNHTILIIPYAFSQYRIQICDKRSPDDGAPPGHGRIVQEMCTYNEAIAKEVVTKLSDAEDALAAARSYTRPWNCEYEGGRIRLDNKKPEEKQ